MKVRCQSEINISLENWRLPMTRQTSQSVLSFSWSRDTLRAGDSWENKTPVYYFSVNYMYNVGPISSSCIKSPCGSSTSMEAHYWIRTEQSSRNYINKITRLNAGSIKQNYVCIICIDCGRDIHLHRSSGVQGRPSPRGHDAFPLCFRFPLFSKKFQTLWKMLKVLPFPEKFLDFHPQKFLLTIF